MDIRGVKVIPKLGSLVLVSLMFLSLANPVAAYGSIVDATKGRGKIPRGLKIDYTPSDYRDKNETFTGFADFAQGAVIQGANLCPIFPNAQSRAKLVLVQEDPQMEFILTRG